MARTEIVEQKQTYVLVGKFLTEKNINFMAMQNVMAVLWRPKEGMEVHDLGGMRYSFVFYHKMDLQKVIDGGSWSFEQAMLVVHQLGGMEDPLTVKIQEVDIWVQVYDIPRGFLSENVIRSVGSSIGKYIKSDSTTFDGVWKPYVRVRVSLNVEKPLKRRMKIKREGDNWSWLNFKYERLGTFCFVCGIIGHSERDCSVVYANPDKVIDKAYGSRLRSPSRNNKNNAGARWLRNSSGGERLWGQKQSQEGMPSTEQDGGGDRFMEVDGVVREVAGNPGGIQIKSRQVRDSVLRDKEPSNDFQIPQGGNAVVTDMESDNVVLDPKRKRVDEDEKQEKDGLAGGSNNPQLTEPKNVQVAGPGIQARQSS